MKNEVIVHLPNPHSKQRDFIDSECKRIIIRAGRRGGKTVGVAIRAIKKFLSGKRVLYAAPTQEQIDRFWIVVCNALAPAIESGVFNKNETKHIIELPGTEQRIRAKTAWNADTLRGDYADELILDEFQLMNEDTWGTVGAPMLLDNDGNAIFIYTPPSLSSRSVSKANDTQHANKLFKKAQSDITGRWKAITFTTYDNPHIEKSVIDDLSEDMTSMSYRMEILAEDIDEAPGSLWKRNIIEQYRVDKAPDLIRVVVGVDPPGGATECGIVTSGLGNDGHYYILDDSSIKASPEVWSSVVIDCYDTYKSDRIVGEKNYGGDMVEHTIRGADAGKEISYKNVTASRGKAVRAEPAAAHYERGKVHHVGKFPRLEDEMCLWQPGDKSPNRLDALVWTLTDLSEMQSLNYWG